MTRPLLPPAGTSIALACLASRPSFSDVVTQLLRRLDRGGMGPRYRFHLIVVSRRASILDVETIPDINRFEGLHLIDIDAPSYADGRNRALATALQGDARYLFFFDDDEHWVMPLAGPADPVRWRPADPFAPHLAAMAAGSVITSGATFGQLSPVPTVLPRITDPQRLRQLGHALRLGSEFLHRRSFVEDAGRWRLRASARLDAPMHVRRGILPLTGGNVMLDLHAVRDGRIPPYHNPPGARGEDALLGARVRHLPVRRVSSCCVHDPFGQLRCLDGEPLPHALRDEPDPDAALRRFGRALAGWIGYAPLLIRLGGGLRLGLSQRARIEQMLRVVESVGEPLAVDLGQPALSDLPRLLQLRWETVEAERERMHEAARAWRAQWRRLTASNGGRFGR